MNWVRVHLKMLFTGKDGVTLDMGRVSWAGCTAAVLALAAYHEHQGVRVPVKDLALALSGLAVTHGAALGLKSSTEPGACPPSQGA
jgi:hypothetical protein